MKWQSLHSFYNSGEWLKMKEMLMLERGGVCQCGCGVRFKGKWDCIPHHIIELTLENVNDYSISLNPDNLLLVRHTCHNRIHARFESKCFRRVFLVWGSPAAGKTTFVRDAANPDDLILDTDLLWCAICTGGNMKPSRLNGELFALRDTLLERIALRSGSWRNAFVIGTFPLMKERRRIVDKFGAEEIFIDTEKEVCLERCKNDQQRQQWVNEFFEKIQQ